MSLNHTLAGAAVVIAVVPVQTTIILEVITVYVGGEGVAVEVESIGLV